VKARQLRRYGFYAAGLAVAWVMLWDRVSAANIVGGLLVAGVLLVIFPLRQVGEDEQVVLHPLAFGRLAASVLGQLVVSNLLVTREVISPNSELLTGIVACRMHTSSPKLLSTVANILALSPGTMAVDATTGSRNGGGIVGADPPATLYVHVLSLTDVGDVRRKVARLERRVVNALGSARDRQELADTATDQLVPTAVDVTPPGPMAGSGGPGRADDEALS